MTIIGQRSITNDTTWGGVGEWIKVMTVREVAQFCAFTRRPSTAS